MSRNTSILYIIFCFVINLQAQDTVRMDEYDRAVRFQYHMNNNKTVFNLFTQANWFPDSTGLWYNHFEANKKIYYKISLPEIERTELFDHQKLADLLTDSMEGPVDPFDLPISQLEYLGNEIWNLSSRGKRFRFNSLNYRLETIPEMEERSNSDESPSPDGKTIAFAKDYNLYLKSPGNEQIRVLSTDGRKGYEYASWYGWGDIMEGENAERPERFFVNWSGDGQWIYTSICDLRSAEKMYLLDWSIDSLFRPKLLSYFRGSPGDTGMVYIEPVFYHVSSGREIRPNLPRSTHINAISMQWSKTPGKVFLHRLERGYQKLELFDFDLNTESLRRIYSETSATNIDNFDFELAEESQSLFFLSEKSGWRQLYKLDLESLEIKSITSGAYYINSLLRIDEENKLIYFLASGKETGRNPYYQHLYRVNFDGSDCILLTHEDRHHEVSLSPDNQYLVDNFSTVQIPTQTVLRNLTSGQILFEMTHADASALKDWTPPMIFTALARDEKTTIYGALWKPTDFDPSKKYPVIESCYTGPHTQVFPKSFSRAFSLQSYAELGFVVLVVDGLGSSGRSKEFHNYSYKNLGGNLEDHVRAIRQLGRQYSWIDTTRVGIFGHSAGGYDAGHAVLAYPDFYKVAVASSADHDHRMEKAWWPEMYMGWPVDSVYHIQSNITMAANLKGKLLITHGGIDENVNPSASFKLAEALIRADKQFDMLILPSQHHGYQGQHAKYFTKLRWNYFIEHLRGAIPLWDIHWDERMK